MVNQPTGNHGLGVFWCGWIWRWKSWAGNLLLWSDLTLDPPSRSNEDSQT